MKNLRAALSAIPTLVVELACLLGIFAYIVWIMPREIGSALPAKGGDLGSHFWTLKLLKEHALANWGVRIWNPGHHLGEPALLHYFPMPFLTMGLLAEFLPIAQAFNLGTILPIFALPICVFVCLKGMRYEAPIPIFGTVMVTIYLFHEHFMIWGGNALSVVAGQFAHLYALCFSFLALGALAWELRKNIPPVLSAVLAAAMALSHAYVAMAYPAVVLGLLLGMRERSFRYNAKKIFASGCFSCGLYAWFAIPMFINKAWITPAPYLWSPLEVLRSGVILPLTPEVMFTRPLVLIAMLVALPIVVGRLINAYQRNRELLRREFRVWGTPLLFLTILIGGAGLIGIVNVRFAAQFGMILGILLGIAISFGLGLHLRPGRAKLATVIVMVVGILWVDGERHQLESNVSYGFTGWRRPSVYPKTRHVFSSLYGSFSHHRVMYEHNPRVDGQAGTSRLFEMLPLFSNRGTIESLYLENSPLSPQIAYLQAQISKQPSCAVPGIKCSELNIEDAIPRLKEFGIGHLILSSPEAKSEANASPHLMTQMTMGHWTIYRLNQTLPLVEVVDPAAIDWLPTSVALIASGKPIKHLYERFFEQFQQVEKDERRLGATDGNSIERILNLPFRAECHPTLDVKIGELSLSTDCPGMLHMLRFAYHPAFQPMDGSSTVALSPGFIGVVPDSEATTFRLGENRIWKVAQTVSGVTAVSLGGLLVFWLRRRRKANDSPIF